jgi:hypothetical protein
MVDLTISTRHSSIKEKLTPYTGTQVRFLKNAQAVYMDSYIEWVRHSPVNFLSCPFTDSMDPGIPE